jgi:hypothetical protein
VSRGGGEEGRGEAGARLASVGTGMMERLLLPHSLPFFELVKLSLLLWAFEPGPKVRVGTALLLIGWPSKASPEAPKVIMRKDRHLVPRGGWLRPAEACRGFGDS